MSQEKDILFLQERISRYYASDRVEEIPSLERREFGFFQFGSTSMHRGIAFSSMVKLGTYLTQRAPKHAYFSSAYYDDPTLPIAQRTWLGADLIFDLDADHIRNAKDLTYEEMLNKVKDRFIYLLEGFMLADLGFDEKDLHLVFSGGRGYHLHVRREDVVRLGARERREIVDYITGRGIDDNVQKERIFTRRAVKADKFKTIYGYSLPEVMPGWRTKIFKCVKDLKNKIDQMNDEEAKDYLYQYAADLNPQVRKALITFLRELPEEDLESGTEITRKKDLTESQAQALLQITKKKMGVEIAGETDEPVTSDIKRVIRIPGSVHGGSGLMAMSVHLDELREFDPLAMALLPALSDEGVKVKWQKKMDIRLGKERFSGEPGMENELPERAAFVLVCRGAVTIES